MTETRRIAAVAMAIIGFTATSAGAEVIIDDFGTATVNGIQNSFIVCDWCDAGGSDKLVLTLSMERDRGDPNTRIAGVTYNDIPMIEVANYGVAYRAKPKARGAANGRIDRGDLTAVLSLLGIPRKDWMGE